MKTNLGKVAITPKGTWNSTTAYTALDTVNFGGGSWLAKRGNIAVTPTEGDDWMQLSAKGADAELTKDSIVSALGYTPERDYGNYELIETITLTEDTAQIIRTQEPDGRAYNFKAAIVALYTPVSTKNGIVACQIASAEEGYTRNEIAVSTMQTYTIFRGRIVGGVLVYEPAQFQNYPGNPMRIAAYPFQPFSSAFTRVATIDMVKVYGVASIQIPTNSTITIYAIRM